MKFWKRSILFCIGGCAYVWLELCYRGRSHGSMFAAGGICFLLLGQLGKVRPRLPLLPRAIVGSGIITMVELAVGLLVNREYEVWDYRARFGNFLGQICPLFSLFWIPVALAAFFLYDALDKKLFPQTR